jgi:chemotaxis protein MotA
MLTGILSIQSGDNPRIVEQKLNSFIAPGKRRAREEK